MTGKIALIGCGIGDPELLTAKAQRKIREADVVVYDRLIHPAILNLATATSEKIYVGKNPTFHPVPQEQIEDILIEKARAGKKIVRLKSGDPYVFGRGGEEGAHLFDEGIEFEVIPGITSAIAGLAYAGIPITHRDFASSFHVFTGHLKSAENEIDWAVAAQTQGTLVFLMGMSELAFITESLIAHGKAPETPAAIIQWAGRKNQKTVVGTLQTIFQQAQEAELVPPSLIVIGGVVSLRDKLDFFETSPLFGVSITVPFTQRQTMLHRLADLGAEVNELPQPQKTLEKITIDFTQLEQLIVFDQLSLTAVVNEMQRQQLDWRRLPQLNIVTVGHHTELKARELGILPDAIFKTPDEFLAAKLTGSQASVYCGSAQQLAEISTAPDYATGQFLISHTEVLRDIPQLWQESDFLYFPSSKTAKLFLAGISSEEIALLKEKKIIVMGAITQAVFKAAGISVMTTPEPSYASVIETLIQEVNE